MPKYTPAHEEIIKDIQSNIKLLFPCFNQARNRFNYEELIKFNLAIRNLNETLRLFVSRNPKPKP